MADDGVRPMGADDPFHGEAKAMQLVESARSSIELLHQATAKGGKAQFFETLSAQTLLSHAQSLRHLSRLLMLESFLRARHGEIPELSKTLRTQFMLGRAFEREPFLISMIVRLDIDANSRQSLELTLGSQPIPEADLRQLQSALRSRDLLTTMRRMLVCERHIGLELFDDLSKSEAQFTKAQKVLWPLSNRSNEAIFLAETRQLIEATKKSWMELLDLAHEIEARSSVKSQKGNSYRALADLIPPDATNGTTGINFARAGTIYSIAYHEAMHRAADAAIAVELFRRRNNRLPLSLDELIPNYLSQPPIDPFTGKLLIYTTRPDGFEIATAGLQTLSATPPSLSKAFRVTYPVRTK